MEEIKNTFLRDLSLLKESEDHIEFKEAKRNFNWDGGDHKDPRSVGIAFWGMWPLWLMREVAG